MPFAFGPSVRPSGKRPYWGGLSPGVVGAAGAVCEALRHGAGLRFLILHGRIFDDLADAAGFSRSVPVPVLARPPFFARVGEFVCFSWRSGGVCGAGSWGHADGCWGDPALRAEQESEAASAVRPPPAAPACGPGAGSAPEV